MASLFFKDIFGGSKPQNGEITINLNLTLKIEADGTLNVAATQQRGEAPTKPQPQVEDKFNYEIPDFELGNKLIDFGKNV